MLTSPVKKVVGAPPGKRLAPQSRAARAAIAKAPVVHKVQSKPTAAMAPRRAKASAPSPHAAFAKLPPPLYLEPRPAKSAGATLRRRSAPSSATVSRLADMPLPAVCAVQARYLTLNEQRQAAAALTKFLRLADMLRAAAPLSEEDAHLVTCAEARLAELRRVGGAYVP